MQYLTICQRVHDLIGYQGQFTSVQATGYQATITRAVQDAYEDIQRYRVDWQWLKNVRNINVSDASDEYTIDELWGAGNLPHDFSSYRYINWTKDNRTRRLIEVPYDAYMLMDFENFGSYEPRLWSYKPWDKSLLISPVDKVYTLELHYLKTLDRLTNNTDVPLIPERHQQAIIYGAVMKLSTFTGDPTLFDTYSVKYAEELGQLMREENPRKVVTKRPIV